jgi:hypothetical protein
MKRPFRIQTWKSSDGDSEQQHFLNDKYGTYVFGFNVELLGKKAYKEVLAIVTRALTNH